MLLINRNVARVSSTSIVLLICLLLPGTADQASAGAVQYARPDSDITIQNWKTNLGGTTDLYQAIDEVTTDNSEAPHAVRSPNNPQGEIWEFGLSDVADPIADTGHAMRWQYRGLPGDAARYNFTVELRQGSRLIAQKTLVIDSDSILEDSYTLTVEEAASITDYADLRGRVHATRTSGELVRKVAIHWFELEVPDPSGPTPDPEPSPEPDPLPTPDPRADNLLVNPGFEQDTVGWSDSKSSAAVSRPVVSGTQSLELSASGGKATHVHQVVDVTAGQTYQVSGWIAVEDVSAGARLQVEWRNGGTTVASQRIGEAATGTTNWTQEDDVLVALAQAIRVRLRLSLPTEADRNGHAWFDDLMIARVD